MQLQTMEDFWRFAKCVLDAGWAPKDMNQSAIVIGMQFGAELGIDPVQAIQNIAVINGKPTVWGDMLLALCMRKTALFDQSVFEEGWTGDGDTLEAYCIVGRIGGKPRRETFSVADTKKAMVWEKGKLVSLWSKQTYQSYLRHMLLRRARSFALRYTFPDVTKGLYSREEMAVDDVLDALDLSGETQAPREPFDASKVTKQPELQMDDGSEVPPGEDQHPLADPLAPEPEPAAPEAPAVKGCPECGRGRSGRAFKHSPGCSKSKVTAAPPPAEPASETPPTDDPASIGVLRRGLMAAFDQLDAPAANQFLHQWGLAAGKDWPNIGACYSVNDPVTLREMYEQVRARLAKTSKSGAPDAQ
jgi:hypothetical protein